MRSIPLSKTHPKFTVIICNHNGGEYVQGAISSLAAQTVRDFEVILIDNGSADASHLNLDTTGIPNFTLMDEGINHGFARANNLAAKQAKAEWLVLLNPDATAEPEWLEQVADGIARYPNVRSFASAQLSMHEDDKMDGAGDNYLFCGFPWRGGFGRPRSEMPREGTCFSACGAGAIYDRQLFLDHGGFDEDLFCYCEDVDLGFRLRATGEECIFLPKAVINHAGSGLTGVASEFAILNGTRNRLWIYIKNMPMGLLILTMPFHVGLTAALLVRGLQTGRAGPTIQALRDSRKRLGHFWAKRKQTQSQRTVSSWALWKAMDVNLFALTKHKTRVREFDPAV